MCGIVGVWGRADRLAEMTRRLAHRGPDDQGLWSDADGGGPAFGHRRLAILDLSAAGHQPMVSACGRHVVCYNGEIYNHRELRAELTGPWRGHSDTETLLAAVAAWGVERALDRANGMFAVALWDRQACTLTLARDRLGEKPLYYGRVGDSFVFASELKALADHPAWTGEIDRAALALFLRFGTVPAPWCIYRGLAKLPPAHGVTVRAGGAEVGTPWAYWDAKALAAAPCAEGDPAALEDRLDGLVRRAVGRRLLSDVPIGAFLSGGIDSSTVTACMQAEAAAPVRTFSIGFPDIAYNEADHARAVAAHLGTDHTELRVTAADALAVVPRLPEVWDEPFADASQVPTALLCALARRHVTVALSGDGGDELFGGYNRYTEGYRLWRRAQALPGPLRRGLAGAIRRLPAGALGALAARLPGRARLPQLADRLPKLADALAEPTVGGYYRRLVALWPDPAACVVGGATPATLIDRPDDWPALDDPRAKMMYLDAMTYLPDDILTKVDRASMAVGLEARVPLLDPELVAFAWSLPMSVKVRDGTGKWLLRRVLDRYVPRALIDRPKQGFAPPIAAWLRGPLRDWAEDLLDETRLGADGLFEPAPIRRAWHDLVGGAVHRPHPLWAVLMVQAWRADTRVGAAA